MVLVGRRWCFWVVAEIDFSFKPWPESPTQTHSVSLENVQQSQGLKIFLLADFCVMMTYTSWWQLHWRRLSHVCFTYNLKYISPPVWLTCSWWVKLAKILCYYVQSNPTCTKIHQKHLMCQMWLKHLGKQNIIVLWQCTGPDILVLKGTHESINVYVRNVSYTQIMEKWKGMKRLPVSLRGTLNKVFNISRFSMSIRLTTAVCYDVLEGVISVWESKLWKYMTLCVFFTLHF